MLDSEIWGQGFPQPLFCDNFAVEAQKVVGEKHLRLRLAKDGRRYEAMRFGMARAEEHGVALLGVRNSFHLGRIGHWAEQCARGGFASIHFVNVIDHPPLQASYGGAQARFSTNPFCAALPGEDGAAVVLDMATSKIAIGKARVARNRGVPAPEAACSMPLADRPATPA